MSVTDAQCRAFTCPAGKDFARMTDGNGLYLEARGNGGKYWLFKYRFAGKEKRIGLGVYPAVSLKKAREKRDEARGTLRDGRDPLAERKVEKARRKVSAATAFEAVAREWHAQMAPNWADSHAKRTLARLVRHVFPTLGRRPIAEIEPPELLAVLRAIGKPETARRAREIVGQVFRYAVASGRANRDPTRDIRDALPSATGKGMPAITNPAQLRAFLLALDGYDGGRGPVVRSALLFGLLTFQRPGEIRMAEWAEFDLDGAMWTIPAARMKRTKEGKINGQDHLVPLSTQAVTILRSLHPLTGQGRFVFPSARAGGRPMSDMATSAALNTIGYKGIQTAHGFRATARTILDEKLRFRPEVIEQHLAHMVKDANGRSYNRTEFLDARREMSQAWADFLDALRTSDNVVPLFKSA